MGEPEHSNGASGGGGGSTGRSAGGVGRCRNVAILLVDDPCGRPQAPWAAGPAHQPAARATLCIGSGARSADIEWHAGTKALMVQLELPATHRLFPWSSNRPPVGSHHRSSWMGYGPDLGRWSRESARAMCVLIVRALLPRLGQAWGSSPLCNYMSPNFHRDASDKTIFPSAGASLSPCVPTPGRARPENASQSRPHAQGGLVLEEPLFCGALLQAERRQRGSAQELITSGRALSKGWSLQHCPPLKGPCTPPHLVGVWRRCRAHAWCGSAVFRVPSNWGLRLKVAPLLRCASGPMGVGRKMVSSQTAPCLIEKQRQSLAMRRLRRVGRGLLEVLSLSQTAHNTCCLTLGALGSLEAARQTAVAQAQQRPR